MFALTNSMSPKVGTKDQKSSHLAGCICCDITLVTLRPYVTILRVLPLHCDLVPWLWEYDLYIMTLYHDFESAIFTLWPCATIVRVWPVHYDLVPRFWEYDLDIVTLYHDFESVTLGMCVKKVCSQLMPSAYCVYRRYEWGHNSDRRLY